MYPCFVLEQVLEQIPWSSQAIYNYAYAIRDVVFSIFVIDSVLTEHPLILTLPCVYSITYLDYSAAYATPLLFTNICRHGYYRYVGFRMISCMNGVVCLAIRCCYCNQCGYRSHREDT
jgi:hypothetical protein